MDIFKKGVLLLLTEECFDKYFEEFDFFDIPCFKASLSKGLGLGIICGSILVKLPQIIKIFNNKSGEGINIYSVILDLFAITSTVAYSFVNGFPFSAWGDGSFLAIQTALIAILVLVYSDHTSRAVAFITTYLAICFVLMSGLTPLHILGYMQIANLPILCVGKGIQALTNYKNGSTGQLSAATCLLLFFGSMARIFTSIQETGDNIMILTYIVSTSANAVIVAQLLYYWNSTTKDSRKKKTQ